MGIQFPTRVTGKARVIRADLSQKIHAAFAAGEPRESDLWQAYNATARACEAICAPTQNSSKSSRRHRKCLA